MSLKNFPRTLVAGWIMLAIAIATGAQMFVPQVAVDELPLWIRVACWGLNIGIVAYLAFRQRPAQRVAAEKRMAMISDARKLVQEILFVHAPREPRRARDQVREADTLREQTRRSKEAADDAWKALTGDSRYMAVSPYLDPPLSYGAMDVVTKQLLAQLDRLQKKWGLL
jgi:hypothetical protein